MPRPLGIVPHVHMKLSVYNTAYNKFKSSNDSASRQTADEKSLCFNTKACYINQKICKASRKCHCPMRESTKCYFNSAVQYGTKAVNERIFFKLFQYYHLQVFLPETPRFNLTGEQFYEKIIKKIYACVKTLLCGCYNRFAGVSLRLRR